MQRALTLVLALASSVWCTGCNTMADAKAAKGAGQARLFDVPTARVWAVLPQVIKEAGLDVVADNRQEGYVLAQRGVNLMTYGENVAIFVQEVRPGPRTRVEIVNKKAIELNVLGNWENELFDRIGQKLQTTGSTPNFAAIDDVAAVPLLNERGRQGYQDWLTKKLPRAFVIAENGAWQSAWGSCTKNPGEPCDPAERALKNCQKRNLKNCKVYAVDNRVVWIAE